MLTVARPSLAFPATAGGQAPLEQPVDVRVPPVAADGQLLGADAFSTAGYVVYRQSGAGAPLDIWDDATKAWGPEAFDPSRAPTPAPLAHEPDQPEPWHGIIVAAGDTDAVGRPRFTAESAGYPRYTVRALFVMADGSEAAVSGPSEAVTFVSAADANLMVIGPGDGETPDGATAARLLLKSPAMDVIGRVVVERAMPGARITIDNAAGAAVVLHPDGHIELRPGAGRGIVVTGDLETERITYLPAAGGAKRVLP